MRIKMLEMAIDERHHDSPEVRSAGHPLEIVSTSVEVGAIQFSSREFGLNPLEGLLVPDVHSKGDLRLASVPPKVTFSYQKAHEESLVEDGSFVEVFHGKHDGETVPRSARKTQATPVAC